MKKKNAHIHELSKIFGKETSSQDSPKYQYSIASAIP